MTSKETTEQPNIQLEIQSSRQFPAWLYDMHISLAFTSYQTGKLFLIGLQPDGRLSLFERTFNRCMGLASDNNSLWMSSLFQLWHFENFLSPDETHDNYDRLYVPTIGYTTGDIDVHDIGINKKGNPIFVNTLFSCLATASKTHSFKPVWKPPFISKLAAEDRCHLNGLAMDNGTPKYVTSVSQTDVNEGWRDHKKQGGIVMDVKSKRIVCDGLSMPHSPRLHNGTLYLLNAGTGYFGNVDVKTGKFNPMTFCPGFLRGMGLIGNFAIVGTSKLRESNLMNDTEFSKNLDEKNINARCGLHVIDLKTGDIVHWLKIDGFIQELYDVAILANCRRPMALGFKSDEIRRCLRIDEHSL